MRNFSKRLFRSDRFYFQFYDQGLTWLAVAIGAITATLYLVDRALPVGTYIPPFG